MNLKMHRVSVVIPTIGESWLNTTIDRLLNGSLVPEEIIVVIPKQYSHRLNLFKFNKIIKILISEKASQVSQRIKGFIESRNKYVLQLDSDILIYKNCLEELVIALDDNKSICVSPRYSTDLDYHASFFKKILFGYFLNREKNFKFWDTWFYRHYEEYNSKLLKTKWLPGGCILHKKENLVLNNYYEYKGKAYDEDLIHSFLLHNNSIDLCVSKKAFAKSINYHAYEHKNFNTLIKYLYRIYKIKVKLSRDSKGNIFYYHIWFFQWFCSETFRYLKTKFL